MSHAILESDSILRGKNFILAPMGRCPGFLPQSRAELIKERLAGGGDKLGSGPAAVMLNLDREALVFRIPLTPD
jgi:hypothetical protein